MMRVLCLLLSALWCASACREKPFFRDAGPLVATTGGKLVGKYVKVFDTRVAAFLGIPFANPPTRFAKAEPASPWRGLLLAHDKPPPCMQYNTWNSSWAPKNKASEDCLYLNVWTPTCRVSTGLPVLVWIYGGGFAAGSTDMEIYDGGVVASYGEAIVVSMNYRLGMFGFMNSGLEGADNNVGLTDQVLALKWVRENIENFGGDSNRITLFGESAGALSISLHMISPMSRCLFQRAILQSGSMYNPQFTDTPELAVAKTVSMAKLADCGDEKTPMEEIVSCFKEKDAYELAKLENTITSRTVTMFLPSVGGEFMPKHPSVAYEEGEIKPQVDVLMGLMKDEGTVFLPIMLPEMFHFGRDTELNLTAAQEILRELLQNLPAREKVISYYLPSQDTESPSSDLVHSVATAFGDFFFNCPVMFLAEKLDTAYLYWMTHRSLRDQMAEWIGVTHFAEVAYVFGVPILDSRMYTPEDGRFSGDLIRKWVAFARDGHPLSDADGSQSWRRFTPEDAVAYELNPRSSKLIPFPRLDACNEVWRPIMSPPSPDR